jgi:Kef-type K+ transport system membrane component KefB
VGQPALVGELISGIALGIVVNHYSGFFPILAEVPEDKVFNALTDLAIFFLMLLAGLETHPRKFAEASGGAFVVAVGGMVVPLAAGLGLSWFFIPESEFKLAQSLFIATALAITAVPVAVKVLMDMGKLQSRLGQTIVSAAIFDDVLSLLLLAVLTAVIKTGGFPDAGQVVWLVGEMLVFFSITGVVGYSIFPLIGRAIKALRVKEIDLSGLLIVGLAFAMLAEELGMHFILGAFVAGLFFTKGTVDKATFEGVKAKVTGVTEGFLAPLFFASIGMHLDLAAATSIPGFVALLVLAAFLCKLIGAGLPAYWIGFAPREALAIGSGMSARGAVELIIADIALRAGLFSKPDPTPAVVSYMFSAVVIMALLTTLLAPIVLKRVLGPRQDT